MPIELVTVDGVSAASASEPVKTAAAKATRRRDFFIDTSRA
jgi:hypothetical protein